MALVPVANGRARADLGALVAELGAASTPPLQDLCATINEGGYELAEALCEHGGVEATLTILAGRTGTPSLVRQMAAEALWLMIRDHESSTRLIQAGGHGQVLSLLRDEGPEDGALAAMSLRVLGESLYSETRSADIWGSAELEVVIQALDWALHNTSSSRNAFVATACNIAALWIWRARGPAVEALAPLLGLIPRLLEVMAEDSQDAELLQQACRVMHGLASRCHHWPENCREPVLAALKSISENYSFAPRPEIHGFSVTALRAVQALPPGHLSTLD